MVLSCGKSLQRRILNLLVDKTVFLTLVGFLTIIVVSITWLGEKWIVVCSAKIIRAQIWYLEKYFLFIKSN